MILRMVFTAAAITLGGAAQAQDCTEVLGRTQEASRFANALTRTGKSVLPRGSGQQLRPELLHWLLFRAHRGDLQQQPCPKHLPRRPRGAVQRGEEPLERAGLRLRCHVHYGTDRSQRVTGRNPRLAAHVAEQALRAGVGAAHPRPSSLPPNRTDSRTAPTRDALQPVRAVWHGGSARNGSTLSSHDRSLRCVA